MSCLHPVSVRVEKYESGGTYVTKSGRVRPLASGAVHYKLVPCGKCLACLAEYQMQMSFRLEQEAVFGGHASTLFVTLTYDNEHLPDGGNLSKHDLERYIANLRQNLKRYYKDSEHTFRYYFCGEYGSKYGRPHYHALLFFPRSIDWSFIQSSWNKGIVDIRPFLPARAGYVAKYSVKQVGLDYCGRVPPFHMSSNGIGKCFIEGKSLETLRYKMYWRNLSGRLVKLPRYYIDLLGTVRKSYKFDFTKDNPEDMRGIRYVSFTHHTPAYHRVKAVSMALCIESENKRLIRSGSFEQMWRDDIEHSRSLEQTLQNLQFIKNGYYKQTRIDEQRFTVTPDP